MENGGETERLGLGPIPGLIHEPSKCTVGHRRGVNREGGVSHGMDRSLPIVDPAVIMRVALQEGPGRYRYLLDFVLDGCGLRSRSGQVMMVVRRLLRQVPVNCSGLGRAAPAVYFDAPFHGPILAVTSQALWGGRAFP